MLMAIGQIRGRTTEEPKREGEEGEGEMPVVW